MYVHTCYAIDIYNLYIYIYIYIYIIHIIYHSMQSMRRPAERSAPCEQKAMLQGEPLV